MILYFSWWKLKLAQTVFAIFQDNAQLCSELSDKVVQPRVQHFVYCIETRHTRKIFPFPTDNRKSLKPIHPEGQDMQELVNVGDGVSILSAES